MALKDKWVDKVNGEDIVDADDINNIAEAVIALENEKDADSETGGADLSDSLPLVNGEASPGTSEEAARADHVHPVDPSRMQNAESIGTITSPRTSDTFILCDEPGKTMARFAWDNLRKLILTYMNGRVVAGSTAAVSDEAETGFVATIEELEDDTRLLTEQDMPRIIKAVKDDLDVWDGGSY